MTLECRTIGQVGQRSEEGEPARVVELDQPGEEEPAA